MKMGEIVKKLTAFVFLGILVVPASGRMCKFDITTCTFDSFHHSSGRGAGWGVHNTSSPSCSVSGISACGDTIISVGEAIAGSPSTAIAPYCWCKMTSPRAGRWVYIHNPMASVIECERSCARFCVERIQTNASIRATILALP